jgi:hypothetical protein
MVTQQDSTLTDDDGDFYSVTLAFRQTIGNKAGGQ